MPRNAAGLAADCSSDGLWAETAIMFPKIMANIVSPVKSTTTDHAHSLGDLPRAAHLLARGSPRPLHLGTGGALGRGIHLRPWPRETGRRCAARLAAAGGMAGVSLHRHEVGVTHGRDEVDAHVERRCVPVPALPLALAHHGSARVSHSTAHAGKARECTVWDPLREPCGPWGGKGC
jgi:hypothetical protein